MHKEMIYQIMNGNIDLEKISLPKDMIIEDEFKDDKPCGQLYDKVYKAKIRLLHRLGVNEDSDIEEIIDSMNEISEILALKMYEYGAGI